MSDSTENEDWLTSSRAQAERVKDFRSLLSQISTLNDKKKKLWVEIYEHAIIDRQNSYMMFLKLSQIAADKSTEHAVHGKTMATYIERMSRANDQLIKLAELVAKAEEASEKDEPVNPEELFKRINEGH